MERLERVRRRRDDPTGDDDMQDKARAEASDVAVVAWARRARSG